MSAIDAYSLNDSLGIALIPSLEPCPGMPVGPRNCLRAIQFAILVCIFAVGTVNAQVVIKQVALPSAEGTVVASAFSPDGKRLAVLRKVISPNAAAPQHAMQIVELMSGQELKNAEVLNEERPDLATSAHFVIYSPDGRFLLLATRGSDVISIIDATTLQPRNRIALHPERRSLGQGHRYFSGVESVASPSSGDSFGVLTHDESRGNEVFVGSFSSGQIINGWSLGSGRTANEFGQVSIALNDDGSMTAVSLLPDGNSLPSTFNNLRLYRSSNGMLVKSLRTDGLIGQIIILPGGTVLGARIDTLGRLSKKTCIEKWNIESATLDRQFCDPGSTVSVALGSSVITGRVFGFASHIRRSIEGHVYAATGRIDVWDMKTGSLLASSVEIPNFVSSIQASSNGEWVMGDGILLQIKVAP